ncbi:MAG TPA: molybdopterin-guanine dinucleotide biosynthesis protein B [Hyphomicrobiaceae bacterium]|nr:molybdopterin-guanine dinucleotide biosynthesis protein B [Hyphomicrobiaceae bacterium]
MFDAAPPRPPVIGIAGWKNSGKTGLVERLVVELARRGLRVATVKHAHHTFDVDPGSTDSARHRRAGAIQVAIVSERRWAIMRELSQDAEPPLEAVIARLDRADIVIVEGYKRAAIPKIEARRAAGARGEPLSASDANVIAIAADHAVSETTLPAFHLDEIGRIADFLATRFRLPAQPR